MGHVQVGASYSGIWAFSIAATKLDTLAVQVVSLHNTPITAGDGARNAPNSLSETSSSRAGLLERRVSFRDSGPSVPGVLTWRLPSSRSTNDLLNSGSPPAQGILPALSADLPQPPAAATGPSERSQLRSAFANAPVARSRSDLNGQQEAQPASLAEVEMVEHVANSGIAEAQPNSGGNGLHMPGKVAEWFKTASFIRDAGGAASNAHPPADDAHGGNFEDSMPLEHRRSKKRQQ